MEDVKIIEMLFERQEKVLELISSKFKNLYKSVIEQILDDKEDVLECENDVLLAIWNSIPPNRPNSLAAYICKLARNISINRYKYNKRAKRDSGYALVLDELGECIPDKISKTLYDDIAEQKEIKTILNDFIKGLDAETRVIFIRRYFYLESVSSIAKRYKISENAVAVKLHRTRKKLHKLLEEEGISI